MNLSPPSALLDGHGRPLRDLRISVTDRCNFRCAYCMPREQVGREKPFLRHAEILRFEEIGRLAGIFVALGVSKLRLTGGEPLLRRDLPDLVSQLAALPGVDLALTTNGSLLARHAAALREAGLQRLTVSLDALEPELFRRMNDTGCEVADVLAGIDAAEAAGFAPLKINVVVRRGVNESQILPIARHFRGRGHIVRFIEYMDVGTRNGWRLDEVVSAREILALLGSEAPLEPLDPSCRGEVAERWRWQDGSGELGVIASVTQAFCRDCTRLRLSPEGRLFTCLFASHGEDIKTPLRDGASDAELAAHISRLWRARLDRYSELRGRHEAPLRKIEMSYIGG